MLPQTAVSLGNRNAQHQHINRGDFLEMLTASAIGNLGNDPELKFSSSGSPFLRFNVATNGRVKNQSGQWEDKTEWVRATVFGQRAESLAEHLRKGMRVYIGGRLEARPWTDNQGNVRAGLEMIADTVEFFSTKPESGGRQESDDGSSDLPF